MQGINQPPSVAFIRNGQKPIGPKGKEGLNFTKKNREIIFEGSVSGGTCTTAQTWGALPPDGTSTLTNPKVTFYPILTEIAIISLNPNIPVPSNCKGCNGSAQWSPPKGQVTSSIPSVNWDFDCVTKTKQGYEVTTVIYMPIIGVAIESPNPTTEKYNFGKNGTSVILKGKTFFNDKLEPLKIVVTGSPQSIYDNYRGNFKIKFVFSSPKVTL